MNGIQTSGNLKPVSLDSRSHRAKQRKASGHAITEFAVGLIVLIAFVFAPLFNIAIIPIRYLIVEGAMTEMSHRVVLCEKRTEAYAMFTQDPWFTSILEKCSVTIANPKLKLTIVSKDGSSQISVPNGVPIPAEWLPDGSFQPSLYSMELSADCSIAPLFSSAAGLPGFTSPITLHLHTSSPWENFSRNPITSQYFVNE
ncbi:MAG: hypothetical protein WC028_13865 [Candidatus Obscuribacterales bacterium]|jgi:hypothetical protein